MGGAWPLDFFALIEDVANVWHHGVHMLLSRLAFSWDVVGPKMPLLGKTDFVFLSSHGGALRYFEVLALRLLHHLLAGWVESIWVLAIRGWHAIEVRVDTFLWLDLLKDLFAKVHEGHWFTSLSPSDNLRKGTCSLNIVPGEGSLELIDGDLTILIFFNFLAHILFHWRFESLLISCVRLFPKSRIFVVMPGKIIAGSGALIRYSWLAELQALFHIS